MENLATKYEEHAKFLLKRLYSPISPFCRKYSKPRQRFKEHPWELTGSELAPNSFASLKIYSFQRARTIPRHCMDVKLD